MYKSWLWLHIYQEGLRDQASHPIHEKAGTWAGFLRPQGKVPGDRFPESNWRRCVRGGGGRGAGRKQPLRRLGERWQRVCYSPGHLGASEARGGRCKRKQVSKIARMPSSPPGPGWLEEGTQCLRWPDLRYLLRFQAEPRPQLQVGTCEPSLIPGTVSGRPEVRR